MLDRLLHHSIFVNQRRRLPAQQSAPLDFPKIGNVAKA
jgi:hypothetical protein